MNCILLLHRRPQFSTTNIFFLNNPFKFNINFFFYSVVMSFSFSCIYKMPTKLTKKAYILKRLIVKVVGQPKSALRSFKAEKSRPNKWWWKGLCAPRELLVRWIKYTDASLSHPSRFICTVIQPLVLLSFFLVII